MTTFETFIPFEYQSLFTGTSKLTAEPSLKTTTPSSFCMYGGSQVNLSMSARTGLIVSIEIKAHSEILNRTSADFFIFDPFASVSSLLHI